MALSRTSTTFQAPLRVCNALPQKPPANQPPDRLPTISATEALQKAAKRSRCIATGLPTLDISLQSACSTSRCGGIQRGQLTEVYGPPGVGKTSFAIQLAVNTIQSYGEHSHVVWIDTGSPLVPRRFRAMMAAYRMSEDLEPPSSPPESRPRKQVLEKLSYFSAQSLPKLLTLFLHPTAIFPPPQTALIIVDDLSNLILSSFPHSSRLKTAALENGLAEKLAKKATNRKWTIVADLASAMSKMAALKSIAVVALNQTATSMKGGRKAALKPALSTPGWDAAVRTRILLYRDFLPANLAENLSRKEAKGGRWRFAQIVKSGGREVLSTIGPVAFVIERGGLRQISSQGSTAEDGSACSVSRPPPDAPPIPTPTTTSTNRAPRPAKRKANEIADCEDEDDHRNSDSDDEFGWATEESPADRLAAEDQGEVESLEQAIPIHVAFDSDPGHVEDQPRLSHRE